MIISAKHVIRRKLSTGGYGCNSKLLRKVRHKRHKVVNSVNAIFLIKNDKILANDYILILIYII